MRQKRRALHEKREKPAQSDIPYRKLRVHPPPLVRQARAGPSDTLDQIIEKAHRIVESELDPKHKRLFRKIGAIAKMRIAAAKLKTSRFISLSATVSGSIAEAIRLSAGSGVD